MKGQRTPAETLERLRKEAKRRLKAIRTGEERALRWYRELAPHGANPPSLRDVQLAIARSLDFAGWTALKRALEIPLPDPRSRQGLVNRFLDNACPDHHVRGRQDHRRAEATAMRLLAQHPEIARHDFNTAVVCGDVEYVREAIARNPRIAMEASSEPSAYRAMSGGENDLYDDLGPKGWTPLLYLCFTRLPLRASNDNAPAIGRMLLEAGADPNAFFHAGGSHYTPMTGVAGEGEEDRPPHPRRSELAKLLLDFGANPYDIQVVYDLGSKSGYVWWLPMVYDASVARGRAADWADPEWRMLDMGGYGCGARWFLRHAIASNNLELARWCLEHGASPNAPPASDERLFGGTLYAEAVVCGRTAIAELLVAHGAARAEPVAIPPRAPHDELHRAARENRVGEIHRLIDSGVSPDIADDMNTRALHEAAWANAIDAARALVARGPKSIRPSGITAAHRSAERRISSTAP